MSIFELRESEISLNVTIAGVDSFMRKVSGVLGILKIGFGTRMWLSVDLERLFE